MKFACLISAYTDPQHLLRLIEALGPNADCFVHVDARADIEPFRRLLAPTGAHLLERRHAIIWGDITQVYYQMDLLRACLATGRAYSRIFLLSGQDYPVWSAARLEEFCRRNPDREFMGGINLTRQRAEVTRQYVVRRPQTWLPFVGHTLNLKWRKLLRRSAYALGVRKPLGFSAGGRAYEIYKGSDYWGITPALARYMLGELDAHPEILRYFRTMYVPSELVWQTLAFQSPFAQKACLQTGPYTSLADLTPLHYIYYEPLIKVLTEADFPAVQQSGKPFCRKVVTGKSDGFVRLCREAQQ